MALVALLYHCVRESDEPWPGDDLLRLSVSQRRFREHLEMCAATAEIVDLGTALRHAPSLERSKNRYVTVTFDDGYIGSLRLAEAALAEVTGCAATVFVPGAHCEAGEPFWWDAFGVASATGAWKEAPPEDPLATLRRLRRLRHHEAHAEVRQMVLPDAWSTPDRPGAWAELRELNPRHLTVGSHGWWHENLSLLPLPELRRDLRAAAARLADTGLDTVPAVAYPFGREGFVEWEQLREVVGVQHCYGVTSEPGRLLHPPTNPLTMRRLIVDDIEATALREKLDQIFPAAGTPEPGAAA